MAILVDTSVWVNFLKKGDETLSHLLMNFEVVCHPYIIGELACGRIEKRNEFFPMLGRLPQSSLAEHAEVIDFIERNKLIGRGVGYIDIHLLISALLNDILLWTADKKLSGLAKDFKIDFSKSRLNLNV